MDFCLGSSETLCYDTLEANSLPNMDVLEPISNPIRNSAVTREHWVCHPDRYHFAFQTVWGQAKRGKYEGTGQYIARR